MPANKLKTDKSKRYSSTKKKMSKEEFSKSTLPERPKFPEILDAMPERPKKRFKDKYESAEILRANEGGMALKPVDKSKNPGLSKLPPEVRNKMGYKKDGGMVLEIGLRPATKQEMKMAKEMKKPIKKAGGGMVRGTGAAITGKGFKGVF